MTYVWQPSCVSSTINQVSANFIFPLRPCSGFKTSGALQFFFFFWQKFNDAVAQTCRRAVLLSETASVAVSDSSARDETTSLSAPVGGGYRGLSKSCGRRQWPAYLFVMYFDRFSSRVQVFNALCIDWLPWSVLPLRVGWMTWPKRPTRPLGGCEGRRAGTCPTRS